MIIKMMLTCFCLPPVVEDWNSKDLLRPQPQQQHHQHQQHLKPTRVATFIEILIIQIPHDLAKILLTRTLNTTRPHGFKNTTKLCLKWPSGNPVDHLAIWEPYSPPCHLGTLQPTVPSGNHVAHRAIWEPCSPPCHLGTM